MAATQSRGMQLAAVLLLLLHLAAVIAGWGSDQLWILVSFLRDLFSLSSRFALVLSGKKKKKIHVLTLFSRIYLLLSADFLPPVNRFKICVFEFILFDKWWIGLD